jgi:hypothetical protein
VVHCRDCLWLCCKAPVQTMFLFYFFFWQKTFNSYKFAILILIQCRCFLQLFDNIQFCQLQHQIHVPVLDLIEITKDKRTLVLCELGGVASLGTCPHWSRHGFSQTGHYLRWSEHILRGTGGDALTTYFRVQKTKTSLFVSCIARYCRTARKK